MIGNPSNTSNPTNSSYDRIINNAINDSKEMNDQSSSSSSSSTAPPGSTKITLYRNGFTVDDGPLRDLESNENKQFLSSLSDGYVPREVHNLLCLYCLLLKPSLSLNFLTLLFV